MKGNLRSWEVELITRTGTKLFQIETFFQAELFIDKWNWGAFTLAILFLSVSLWKSSFWMFLCTWSSYPVIVCRGTWSFGDTVLLSCQVMQFLSCFAHRINMGIFLFFFFTSLRKQGWCDELAGAHKLLSAFTFNPENTAILLPASNLLTDKNILFA